MQDGPRSDWSTDMQRYHFTQDYRSGIGAWKEGDQYDFDPEMAAFIQRDSPGTIELVPGTLVFVPDDDDGDGDEPPEDEEPEDEEPEDSEDEATRTLDGPPHDRMVKSARKRGD